MNLPGLPHDHGIIPADSQGLSSLEQYANVGMLSPISGGCIPNVGYLAVRTT